MTWLLYVHVLDHWESRVLSHSSFWYSRYSGVPSHLSFWYSRYSRVPSHFSVWYSRYSRVLSHFSLWYSRYSRLLSHFSGWYFRYSRVLISAFSTPCTREYSAMSSFWYSRDWVMQNDWYSRVIDWVPMTGTGTLTTFVKYCLYCSPSRYQLPGTSYPRTKKSSSSSIIARTRYFSGRGLFLVYPIPSFSNNINIQPVAPVV